MGIRYYAYAFDEAQTEQALAEPNRFLSWDPLADAWGFPPGASISTPTFEQAVPKRDMLYLDKAWGHLQALTGPDGDLPARPSYRMFEGSVVHHHDGWERFVRALAPAELPSIAADLEAFDDAEVAARLSGGLRPWVNEAEEISYALEFLGRARVFATGLARDGRGMVYMIG